MDKEREIRGSGRGFTFTISHYHSHSPCRPLSCLVLSLTVTAKSVTSLLSRTEDDMEGIKGRQAVEEEEKEAPVMQ